MHGKSLPNPDNLRRSQIDQALEELQRERAARDRVFPKLIEAGRLAADEARRRNVRLDTAIRIIDMLRHTGWILRADFTAAAEAPVRIRATFRDTTSEYALMQEATDAR